MKRLKVTAAYVAAVALALACAVIVPPGNRYPTRACVQEVHGACIVYDVGAQQISPEQWEVMFREAAEHWSTNVDAIAGYTVVVKGRDPYKLGEDWIWGVTIFDLKRLDFAVPVPFCPELVFVHEWGHAGAGVRGHDDPRFEDAAIRKTLTDLGRAICR